MAEFAEPWLLLLTWKDGRKRVLVEATRTREISLQLGHILRADRCNLDVIDAAGNYFQRAAGSIAGIDWRIFRHAPLVAPFVLPFMLLFSLRPSCHCWRSREKSGKPFSATRACTRGPRRRKSSGASMWRALSRR